MVHRDFAKQFRLLQLGLQQVLLRAHSGAIAGVRRLPNLLEQVTVLFEDRQCFGQVGQLEIRRLEICEDSAAHRLDLLLRNIRFSLRNLTLQAQLARIGNILRNSQADIRKIAVRVAGEGARATYAQMLQSELRVGQCRDLRRSLLVRLPTLSRRFDLRIVLLRFREQFGEWCDRSRVGRCGLLREDPSRENDGEHNRTKTGSKNCKRKSSSGILSRYRKHLFLLNVHDETADRRRVAHKGLDRNGSAGQRDSGDGKRDKPVRCRTAEQRIRSGGKSEGCTTPEANAGEPQNPSGKLRGTRLPVVKREYR